MKRNHFYILLVALLTSSTIFAQNISITGVIVDKKTSESLIGATVLQKGTNNGTITNFDGNFSISVPLNATLVISYIGYVQQEIVVKDQNPLRILMAADAEILEEVVVVGYGTQKAKDMTAPISTVKGSDLNKQTTSNAMSALQGKMSGVQIVSSLLG